MRAVVPGANGESICHRCSPLTVPVSHHYWTPRVQYLRLQELLRTFQQSHSWLGVKKAQHTLIIECVWDLQRNWHFPVVWAIDLSLLLYRDSETNYLFTYVILNLLFEFLPMLKTHLFSEDAAPCDVCFRLRHNLVTYVLRPTYFRIVYKHFGLKCLKKRSAQELTESNRDLRLQQVKTLLKMYSGDQLNTSGSSMRWDNGHGGDTEESAQNIWSH